MHPASYKLNFYSSHNENEFCECKLIKIQQLIRSAISTSTVQTVHVATLFEISF